MTVNEMPEATETPTESTEAVTETTATTATTATATSAAAPAEADEVRARRKVREGTVVSNKMDKTAVVAVQLLRPQDELVVLGMANTIDDGHDRGLVHLVRHDRALAHLAAGSLRAGGGLVLRAGGGLGVRFASASRRFRLVAGASLAACEQVGVLGCFTHVIYRHCPASAATISR